MSQGEHDALREEAALNEQRLQQTIEAQREALADMTEEVAGLRDALGAEQQKGTDLEAALARAEGQAESLQGRITELEGEIARLMRDRTQLTDSVSEMQRALRELQERKAETEARIAEYRDLLARFKPLIDAGKLRVKIVDGRMVVELATDVLFDSGKAELSESGEAAIIEVNDILKAIPERRYQVEGHTDNVPIANARFPSNWELASARALTVLRAMVSAGMGPERVSAASYADTRPVGSNQTPQGRAANRRIEIVVVPDLSGLPGFEELESLPGR